MSNSTESCNVLNLSINSFEVIPGLIIMMHDRTIPGDGYIALTQTLYNDNELKRHYFWRFVILGSFDKGKYSVLDGNILGGWIYDRLKDFLPENVTMTEFGIRNDLRFGGSDQGHPVIGGVTFTRQNSHPHNHRNGIKPIDDRTIQLETTF